MPNLKSPDTTELKKLQAIPKWTQRYAQNRTLPFLLFMVLYLLMSAVIGGSSYLGGFAYLSGNMPLFCLAMVGLVLGVGFCLWFANPWWGGKWMEKTATRMYAQEGLVTPQIGTTEQSPAWLYLAGSLFGLSIVVSVILGLIGLIPIRLMQPVSALYTVPFLVFLSLRQRPLAGWIPFLWPTLYGLHAILVVAGVPIQFDEKWSSLNMLIPVAGYGLLSGLIGYFYGRYALKRLQGIAGVKE